VRGGHALQPRSGSGAPGRAQTPDAATVGEVGSTGRRLPRRRQIDLAIAATATVDQVPLLTHDLADVEVIRDLVDVRRP
jgi:predicted nucleic acid-binding protein